MDPKFDINLWSGLQMPRRLAVENETLTDRYGRFSAQPFERGFGTTIGNSLRRALLSSIEGAAITAVKIEGVEHEFSSINGVVEDATDVILNLKQIPIKLHGGEAKTLTISVTGAGEVLSGDIEADADVEVLDPNIYIATVLRGGSLNIEMRLKRGRGYVPADRNFDEDLSLGYIPVDSVHTPVKKVNYTVEAARLGQNTEFDKLTIEVWTDGSVKPDDAVGLAAKLIKDHMAIFINFEEDTDELAYTGIERPPLPRNDQLDRSVDELELSVRSYNCLKNANIRTIRDLVQRSEREMEATKNFGRKSLNEIKDILHGMGLDFGMEFDEQGNPIPGTGGKETSFLDKDDSDIKEDTEAKLLAYKRTLFGSAEEKHRIIRRMFSEEIKPEQSLRTALYVNLWIENENQETLLFPLELVSGIMYRFLFAVENKTRKQGGITEPFVESERDRKEAVIKARVEVHCSFLEGTDDSEYQEREVNYRIGEGFQPQVFNLNPTTPGRFYLTAGLVIRGETRYRKVLVLNVTEATADSQAIKAAKAFASI